MTAALIMFLVPPPCTAYTALHLSFQDTAGTRAALRTGISGSCAQVSMVGLLRQNTARPDPPRAMKTTDTAEGTATRGSEKWVCASRNPRAALCMPARYNARRRQSHSIVHPVLSSIPIQCQDQPNVTMQTSIMNFFLMGILEVHIYKNLQSTFAQHKPSGSNAMM